MLAAERRSAFILCLTVLAAGMAASGPRNEIMRVVSTDLDGLGGAGWTPTGPPPSGGAEIGSGTGELLLRFSGFGDLQYEARDGEPGAGGETYAVGF